MKLKIAGVLLFLTAVSAGAQTTVNINKAGMQKMVTARKITLVRPLSQNVKLNKVRNLMQGKIPAQVLSTSSLLEPTELSVTNPVKGGDFLKFNLPSQVSPQENSAFFQPLGGNLPDDGVLVAFNAPADGYYVFDFSTEIYEASQASPVTLVFKGLFNPEYQEQKIYKDDGHVIFITKEVKAGANIFFLGGNKASWNFYSVGISQFKVGG